MITMCIAALCLTAACGRGQMTNDAQQVNYESAERLAYYTFRDGIGSHGVILPATKEYDLTSRTAEALGYPLVDCSDAAYLCLRTFHSVLAVPRDGNLTAGRQFSADGARLRVIECFATVESPCRAALIASACEVLVSPDRCALAEGGSAGDSQIQQTTYFIYNRDFGVTSFGTGGAMPASAEQVASAAQVVSRQYLLQGTTGLLVAQVKTSGN